MNKFLSYIIGFILVAAATIPPIHFVITSPGEYFPWIMVLVIFAGFYLLFLPVNILLKIISMFGLVSAFTSTAPLVSFISYIWWVAGCYFYFLCMVTRDTLGFKKMLYCLMAVNGFMFVMQALNMDPLLNFNQRICFGVVGQHMQSASFSVILAAALVPSSIMFIFFPLVCAVICNSAGAFISATAGLSVFIVSWFPKKFTATMIIIFVLTFSVWMIKGGKLLENTSMSGGRLGVWTNTLNLCKQKPLMGWGIGTYKALFPAIGGIKTIPWKTAHNCWLQILFETGILGFSLFFGYFVYLVQRLIKLKKRATFRSESILCLSILVMVFVNMCFHFPTRMIQTIFLLIYILATCQKVVNYGYNKS